MTDAPVYLRQQDGIAELMLNRPDRKNALTQAMWEAIPDLVAQAASNADMKVLVLRSSTPGVFSAGADIAEFEAISKDPARREANRLAVREAQRSLALLEKPTIAMIDGACVGGGCGLAVACDLRLASSQSRLGITPVKLGLIYSVQDAKQLMELVGPAHAKSILFTGRLVSAEEALGMGLVNALYPADELEHETHGLAQTIAANSQWGVRGIKRVMRMILNGVTDDTPETEEMFRQSFGGADYREGVDAFLNRRKADFPYR